MFYSIHTARTGGQAYIAEAWSGSHAGRGRGPRNRSLEQVDSGSGREALPSALPSERMLANHAAESEWESWGRWRKSGEEVVDYVHGWVKNVDAGQFDVVRNKEEEARGQQAQARRAA